VAEPDPAVLARHLDYLRMLGRSPAMIRGRRNAVVRLGAALPGPLLEASGEDLLAWRSALAVSDGTVRSYVSHARQFYGWAARAGYVPASPAGQLPVPRKARRLPRPIATADLFYAVSVAPPRIRPWLILAAWCGLRAKEIALLRRECVMLAAAQPVILIAGDATKGKHERTVPVSRFAAGELAAAQLPLTGWCFPRGDGRPGPNHPARVSGLAAAFLRSAGIPATLHQLRHWFGTSTYAVNKDLRAVQELMGHRTVESTQGYADWDRSAASAAVEALPAPPRLRVVGAG
jgi:integrase